MHTWSIYVTLRDCQISNKLRAMADDRPDVGPLQPESAGDNLRVYLKEMGSVPLLTRQAEIVLARRMERGRRRVVGSLAQCEAIEEDAVDERRHVDARPPSGSLRYCSKYQPFPHR